MAIGSFEIEIVRSMHQNYHALVKKLRAEGKTEQDILDKFNEIAISHNAGSPPPGNWTLPKTPAHQYQSYGWKIFGNLIAYHVRPGDQRIIIDVIRL